jgi:hypothetical protein
MKKIFDGFFSWYNKHLALNTAIAAFLFALQLVHLYWLTTDVVLFRLTGQSYFNPSELFQTIIILVDYTEIPAIITTSLVYINEYRKKKNFKSILYLFFLNIQLVHIFWITDEFVVEQFSGMAKDSALPNWAAWVAILIDYLELPVIIETFRELFKAIKKGDLKKVNQALNED